MARDVKLPVMTIVELSDAHYHRWGLYDSRGVLIAQRRERAECISLVISAWSLLLHWIDDEAAR